MLSIPIRSCDILWQCLIRPTRSNYFDLELGPSSFTVGTKPMQRTDFSIVSSRGCRLECSHFEPEDSVRTSEDLPCIIYLHSNTGNRIEGLIAVPALVNDMTLVCFDWAGCGKSEGQFISLGPNESQDLCTLILYLKTHRRVGKIGLWGKCMGAAAGIMTAGSLSSMVHCLVLDSPYGSLKQVWIDTANRHSFFPHCALKAIFDEVKEVVKEIAEIDIDNIKPISFSNKCYQPAMFLSASKDSIVSSKEVFSVFKSYQGEKTLIKFSGTHTSERPDYIIDRICKFFSETFSKPSVISKSEGKA